MADKPVIEPIDPVAVQAELLEKKAPPGAKPPSDQSPAQRDALCALVGRYVTDRAFSVQLDKLVDSESNAKVIAKWLAEQGYAPHKEVCKFLAESTGASVRERVRGQLTGVPVNIALW